jgi:hypothetical protein
MATRAHFLRIYGSFTQREKIAAASDNPMAKAFVNNLVTQLTGKKALKELEGNHDH